jgi:hypothetical protein
MSIKSFKFVSPGVFVNEVDNSQLPRLAEDMGPVIIGRAERGPAMVPVKISSFAEFVETFGEPIAGGQADDAWRQGNRIGPTYGAFAAQAYLRNGSPVTFVRLLGETHKDATENKAGWKMDKAHGIYVDTDGTATDAHLGAVIYTAGTSSAVSAAVTTGTDIKITITRDGVASAGTSASQVLTITNFANAQDDTISVAKTLASDFTISFDSGKTETTGTATTLVIGTADIDSSAAAAAIATLARRIAQEVNNLGTTFKVTASPNGATVSFTMDIVDAVTVNSNELLVVNATGDAGMTRPALGAGQGTPASAGTTSDKVYIVNFDRKSKKYIRKVLNTNPTLTNASITSAATATEGYFLGATFDQHLEKQFDVDINFATAAVIPGYEVHTKAHDASGNSSSPWVLSQYMGSYADLASPVTPSQLSQLFRIHSLYSGEWEQRNFKISIIDVKPPSNDFVKYGTFTLLIRSASDNDASPIVYERFSNMNLDPTSSKYIGAVIGDMKMNWKEEEKRYTHIGEHANQSRFIRVEVNSDVDSGAANPELLPFGFALPSHTVISDKEVPKLVTRTNTKSDTKLSSPKDACFGISTDRPDSVGRFDESYQDIVRLLKGDEAMFAGTELFSLDLIQIEKAAGQDAKFVPASLHNDTSFNGAGGSYEKVLDAGFNKFTMPLCGGSDGLDITEVEPFCDRLTTDTNAVGHYAYNTISKAIDIVADPEVVECNLMAIPGVATPGLTGKLISVCENRGDALAIIDIENDYTPRGWNSSAESLRLPKVTGAVTSLKDRGLSSSYGCAFFPWVQVTDDINNRKVWMPPSVVALGTMASSAAKSELWFAPAGFTRGGLSAGAGGLPVSQVRLRLNSKDRDALYEANINPIAQFPAEGIVVFGQKTLQVTPSALDRINVRRLMIHVKKEISRMAATTLFDQNVQATWNRFLGKAEPFLASVQSRFGLTEYKIVLDETTTTPELIDRNIAYAKVFLKPARAIEFIAIDFVITNTGASFDD